MPTKVDINAIIFDLGKVIVQTNVEKTTSALKKMCNQTHIAIDNLLDDQRFQLFELGEISEQEFLYYIKTSLFLNGNILDIEEAWNAMILGISYKCIKMLNRLKKLFPIYALSNTNICHVRTINNYLLKDYCINDIRELFNKVYFSHELKLSKPDRKIFEYVIADLKIPPSNMLFIDDNINNIEASKKIGFQTIHLTHQGELINELKKIGIPS